MHITYETLDALGIKDKPVITLFNKQDLRTDMEPLHDFRADHVLAISAGTGSGLSEVKELLAQVLRDNKIYVERVIPYENAGILQLVRTQGELVAEEYGQDGIAIRAYVPMEVYGKL
jgi:GTP-binding protein HflX